MRAPSARRVKPSVVSVPTDVRHRFCLGGRAPDVFALQSPPPSLGPPLVALVVLAAVGVVIGALGSAVVRRLSNTVGKYRLLYAGVLFPYALLAFGVLALLGLGPAVVAAAGFEPGLLSGGVGYFVAFLAAGVVGLAAYAPTIRGVRAARGVDLPTGRALAAMARYVVGLSALAATAMAVLRLGGDGVPPLALAAGLPVVVAVFLYASPWVLPLLRATTTPSGETGDRLAALRTRAGLDVRDAVVLDTDDAETASAHVRGPPGYRRLFVTSTFLDAFDDDPATALLAVQAGRADAHVLERRVGSVVVAAVPLVAAVSGVGPRWPLLGLAAAAVVVGFWLTRRGVRAADDYAAARVGADAVADAFERYAEIHAMEPSRRRVPNPLSATVSLGDRIDRLRE
jgi:STE24 endopeptidase